MNCDLKIQWHFINEENNMDELSPCIDTIWLKLKAVKLWQIITKDFVAPAGHKPDRSELFSYKIVMFSCEFIQQENGNHVMRKCTASERIRKYLSKF